MRAEIDSETEWTDMRMISCICNKESPAQICRRLGVEAIGNVMSGMDIWNCHWVGARDRDEWRRLIRCAARAADHHS